MRNKQKGFTLIELLVVIAIIGILSSVVLASLNTARQKGRDARRISDVKQTQLALELYYDSNQTYPLTITTSLTGGGYIPTLPLDPVSNVAYAYVPLAESGDSTAATTCTAPDICASYVLAATLEVTTNTVLTNSYNAYDFTGAACTTRDTAGVYCVTP